MNRFLFPILLVFISTNLVLATDGRVNALSGYHFFLIDESNIFDYPSSLLNYPNKIICELEDTLSKNHSIFLSLPIGKNFGVLGVAFNKIEIPEAISTMYDSVTPYCEPNPLFTFLFAKRSDDISWGVLVSYIYDRYKDENINSSLSAMIARGGLNYRIHGENFIEIGAELGMYKGLGEDPFKKIEGTGKFSYGLDARLYYLLSREFVFIPVFGFENIDGSYKISDITYDNTSTFLYGGLGGDIPLYYELDLIFGLLVEYIQNSFGTEFIKNVEKNLSFPAMIGLEARIRDWFLVRFGGVKDFSKVEISDDSKRTHFESDFSLLIGLGLRIGNNLYLDMKFNNDLLFKGPYFVGGSEGMPITHLSIKYDFE